jgi:putative transposase
VVNQFIDLFWNSTPKKKDLGVKLYSQASTWFSPTMCQIAAREALDMISSARERDKNEAVKPIHHGKKMQLTAQVVKWGECSTADFDVWLTFSAIAADRSVKFSIPLKSHKHIQKLERRGFTRMNSFVVREGGVQLAFQREIEIAEPSGDAVGVDSGINALCSTSDGEQFGLRMKELVEKWKRCAWGSKAHKRAQAEIRQYIREEAKRLFQKKQFRVLVVEGLHNLSHGTRLKRRLSKNMRRSVHGWRWRLWLDSLKALCDEHCVSYQEVNPAYTSQTCPACGFVNRGNRRGEKFQCLTCGHADNADINGAVNILKRFLGGVYGPSCKGAFRPNVSVPSANQPFILAGALGRT